jgi:hypothetical protein
VDPVIPSLKDERPYFNKWVVIRAINKIIVIFFTKKDVKSPIKISVENAYISLVFKK